MKVLKMKQLFLEYCKTILDKLKTCFAINKYFSIAGVFVKKMKIVIFTMLQ